MPLYRENIADNGKTGMNIRIDILKSYRRYLSSKAIIRRAHDDSFLGIFILLK